MDNTRIVNAAALLRQCKTQGLKYYDATQVLAKQGFSQEEIEQASLQFPYSDPSPAGTNSGGASVGDSMNQAFAEAVTNEEAIDNTKKELAEDAGLGLLGGRSLVGQYFGSKAITDYAALKDLQAQQHGTLQPTGPRVFQRHRAVKYYAILSLAPLIFLVPYMIELLRGIVPLTGSLLTHHSRMSAALIGLYVWSAVGCVTYACMAVLLFVARKEATLIKFMYGLFISEFLVCLVMALLLRSVGMIIVGILITLPAYWISKRVGLLSQLL